MVEEKMQLWLQNGARLVWLVDPMAANVTIYSPSSEPVHAGFVRQPWEATDPVAGFVLKAERLWPSF